MYDSQLICLQNLIRQIYLFKVVYYQNLKFLLLCPIIIGFCLLIGNLFYNTKKYSKRCVHRKNDFVEVFKNLAA